MSTLLTSSIRFTAIVYFNNEKDQSQCQQLNVRCDVEPQHPSTLGYYNPMLCYAIQQYDAIYLITITPA